MKRVDKALVLGLFMRINISASFFILFSINDIDGNWKKNYEQCW